MAWFKSNKDLDSTLIILGIHAILGGILYMEFISETNQFDSVLSALIPIYSMIAGAFFKSQVATPSNDKENG